jgi:hypothetical protein
MGALLISLLAGMASTLRTRTSLQVEILALRRQLAVLKRTKRRRVPLRAMDRPLQAFPWDTAPRYLLHDRDRIYGDAFRVQAANMAVTSVLDVLVIHPDHDPVDRLDVRQNVFEHSLHVVLPLGPATVGEELVHETGSPGLSDHL